MLIESIDNQLWDYNETEQYLLRLSDGWLIENVLPEQLEEICLGQHEISFRKGGGYHRENGPAIERINGDKIYWRNNKLHREDGPAIEYASGYKEYWLVYKQLSYKEWLERTNKC